MDQVEPVNGESAASKPVESFDSLTHFGGFDWGASEHQFAMVDREGNVLMNLRLNDDAQGWASCARRFALLAPGRGHRDQHRCGGGATAGVECDCLSDESQGGRAFSRSQGAFGRQERLPGCLVFFRCAVQ